MSRTQHPDVPRKQARIRAYIFEGAKKLKMWRAVQAMPAFLHVSVFLFFAGLIDYLFPINNTVAWYTFGCIVSFTSLYAVLTFLPILYPNSPYFTPLTLHAYYLFHLSGFILFWAANKIEGIFHRFFLDIRRRFHQDVPGSPNHGPTKWREVLEEKVHTYRRRSMRGLVWRIVDSAMQASSRLDKSALHWMLTTLDENTKIEDFASRVPGFFDCSATPDATSAMLSLMSDSEQPKSVPILGSRLHELLKTCRPGSLLLTEEQRKSRLRVCQTSLWYCLRAFNLPKNAGEALPPYVLATFASPGIIRWIQTEVDLSVRLLGRCFGSLVAKKLANDIYSRPTPTTAPTPVPTSTPTGISATNEEMAFLQSILGTTDQQVRGWLDHRGAIDLANVTFLISGELETLVDNGTHGVPDDVVDVFQQTLRILAEGMFSSQADIEWDTDQVAQFREIYFKFADAPVPDLLKERLQYIWDKLPPSPS